MPVKYKHMFVCEECGAQLERPWSDDEKLGHDLLVIQEMGWRKLWSGYGYLVYYPKHIPKIYDPPMWE